MYFGIGLTVRLKGQTETAKIVAFRLVDNRLKIVLDYKLSNWLIHDVHDLEIVEGEKMSEIEKLARAIYAAVRYENSQEECVRNIEMELIKFFAEHDKRKQEQRELLHEEY